MPYNPNFALTNAQLRDQGMQNALENFMGYFKAIRAQKDDAEKEGMIDEISKGTPAATVGGQGGPDLGMDAAGMPTGLTSGAPADAAKQHLAEVKARYLNKYGAAPATGQDMLNQDLLNEEKLATIGDSKRKRTRDIAQEGKLDAFGKVIESDTSLSDPEKAFYGAKPEAYGERLKPTPVTYLPSTAGFLQMPTKTTPGAAATPTAGPIQLPGGAVPKPVATASQKTTEQIQAEAEARARGTAAGNPNAGDPKQNQSAAAGFGKRALLAQTELDDLIGKGFDPAGKMGVVANAMPGAMQSDERQRYNNAKLNFKTAILRKESGASISPTEDEGADKLYFPQPGDGPETIKQKARARAAAIASLKAEAGKAWDTVADVGGPANVAVGTVKTNAAGMKVRWNGSFWEHAE